MKKEIFLKQFPKEAEYEASRLYNSFESAKEYGVISYTEEFFTPNFWKRLTRKIEGIEVATSGGFKGSDRRQVAFIPREYIEYIKLDKDFEGVLKEDTENYMESNYSFLEFPYRFLKIQINSKFKEYSHRDFLGSLMGLNIKRELMGDLVMEEGIGYIPVSEKIKEIILNNLSQIGKAQCLVSEIKGNDKIPDYKYDDKIITVPSKRLDSIVSAITGLSRTKVVEPIERGKVLVDYAEEKEKSKNLEIGSLITIRGYGKFKLFSDKGETKKGKERLLVKKYV